MDKYDHGFQKRIEKIRNLLQQNQGKHRSADQVSKQTYDFLREKLTVESGGFVIRIYKIYDECLSNMIQMGLDGFWWVT